MRKDARNYGARDQKPKRNQTDIKNKSAVRANVLSGPKTKLRTKTKPKTRKHCRTQKVLGSVLEPNVLSNTKALDAGPQSLSITKVLDGGPHGPLIVVARHQAATQGALKEDQSQFPVRHLLVHGHRLKKKNNSERISRRTGKHISRAGDERKHERATSSHETSFHPSVHPREKKLTEN